MQSLSIVERLQILKDRLSSLRSALIGLPIDTLRFEGAEEALHERVVIAISFAAHAHQDPIVGQQLLIGSRSLLTATVGMVQ